MNAKQRAAEAALPYLQNGMTLGLGTGSTADFFLQALGAALKSGKLKDIHGVPTSRACELRAQQLGIPLVRLIDHPELDVTVDGADEIAPNLDLIKGLGGALLREKIVAQSSKKFIIIADGSKTVPYLGAKAPLPVEVVPFSHETHVAFFRTLGAEPTLRQVDGKVFNTDNGNVIYDCKFDRIENPAAMQAKLMSRAGIVGSGLFVGMATTALVADEQRVDVRERK